MNKYYRLIGMVGCSELPFGVSDARQRDSVQEKIRLLVAAEIELLPLAVHR